MVTAVTTNSAVSTLANTTISFVLVNSNRMKLRNPRGLTYTQSLFYCYHIIFSFLYFTLCTTLNHAQLFKGCLAVGYKPFLAGGRGVFFVGEHGKVKHFLFSDLSVISAFTGQINFIRTINS